MIAVNVSGDRRSDPTFESENAKQRGPGDSSLKRHRPPTSPTAGRRTPNNGVELSAVTATPLRAQVAGAAAHAKRSADKIPLCGWWVGRDSLDEWTSRSWARCGTWRRLP